MKGNTKMGKMKAKELLACEDVIKTFRSRTLWEFDFALKVKEELAHAVGLIEELREQYLSILKANGGVEEQDPRTGRDMVAIKQPVLKQPEGGMTAKDVEAMNESNNRAIAEYNATMDIVRAEADKLDEKEITVKVNKIPAGEFKSNFISYTVPELKGKKFAMTGEQIELLDWFINFKKK